MSQSSAVDLARMLFPDFLAQHEHAKMLNTWYKGKQAAPQMPASRPDSSEYDRLRARSVTSLAGTVVTGAAQAMYVDGHRPANTRDNTRVWDAVWQPNQLDSKQTRFTRGTLAHGVCHSVTLPGTNPMTGAALARIRGVSAMRMASFSYQDEDDITVAIEGDLQQGDDPRWALRLYDDEAVYFMSCDTFGDNWAFIETRPHRVGVIPVVPFYNLIDLDGEFTSEIGPIIPIVQRFDQDNFDRLVVQRDGSWKVRWATGVEKPAGTADQARAAAAKMRVQDMLINASPDGRFGTLDGTSPEGYLAAAEADLRTLAAVSQTPAHHLLGQISNVSADALAAAEATLMRKVTERKTNLGESWEATLRIAAWINGDTESASDFSSQVRWRDTEIRSISQTADALGKLAEQLNIPVELLWSRVPGWTESDSIDAKRMISESGDFNELFANLTKELGAGPITEDSGRGDVR